MKTKKINNKKLNYLLPELEKRIKDSFGDKLKKIILYGSYARGDYDSESDVDILVLIDDNNLYQYRIIRNKIVSDFLEEFDFIVSIRINDEHIFSDYKNIIPFYKNVLKDGIFLYG